METSGRPAVPIGQRAGNQAENQEVTTAPPTSIDIERAGGLALPQSVEMDLGSLPSEQPHAEQGTEAEGSTEGIIDVFEGITRPQRKSTLTLREQQIIALAAKGLSHTESAVVLNIGRTTVKSHHARIGVKLGTGDSTSQVSDIYELGGKVPESVRHHFGLSERAAEIVELAAQGRSNASIGRKLFISEHTVKTHLSGALQKVGAKNRTHLVTIMYGLVGRPEADSPGESEQETPEQTGVAPSAS